MTRSGYREDLDYLELGRWRGMVASAIRGKRGQALLKDIAKAMDAMPEKCLGAGAMVTEDGSHCTLACAMKERNIPIPDEFDPDDVASKLDIARCLAQEVTYITDEATFDEDEDGYARWRRVRAWVDENIAKIPETGS